MQSLPRISVVVPSYNQVQYLQACLDSLYEQQYPGLELIVMDGGSSDGSRELLERQAGRFTHWQSEPDGGQPRALNLGFERASGHLFTWLNSDDILLPGALRHAARCFQQTPHADVMYGDQVDLNAAGEVVERFYHPAFSSSLAWWTVPYIPQPGTLFRAELWRRVEGVDPELQCMFDHDLWMRFMRQRARFVHVGRALAGFRRHSESKGGSWFETYSRERQKVAEQYASERGSPWQRALARAAFVSLQTASGNYAKTLTYRVLRHGRLRKYEPG